MDPRTQAALDFSVDAVSAASFDYGKQSRTHRMDSTPPPRPMHDLPTWPPTD